LEEEHWVSRIYVADELFEQEDGPGACPGASRPQQR
jgi:hypothetical protein